MQMQHSDAGRQGFRCLKVIKRRTYPPAVSTKWDLIVCLCKLPTSRLVLAMSLTHIWIAKQHDVFYDPALAYMNIPQASQSCTMSDQLNTSNCSFLHSITCLTRPCPWYSTYTRNPVGWSGNHVVGQFGEASRFLQQMMIKGWLMVMIGCRTSRKEEAVLGVWRQSHNRYRQKRPDPFPSLSRLKQWLQQDVLSILFIWNQSRLTRLLHWRVLEAVAYFVDWIGCLCHHNHHWNSSSCGIDIAITSHDCMTESLTSCSYHPQTTVASNDNNTWICLLGIATGAV